MQKSEKSIYKLLVLLLGLILINRIFGLLSDTIIVLALSFFLILNKLPIEKKILIFLIFSVLCTNRFTIRGINFRYEDVVAIIMFIYLLVRKDIKWDKLDIFIIFFIIYNIVVLVINAGNRTEQLKYMILIVKYFQYFVYFFFLKKVLKEKSQFDCVITTFKYCAIANIIYGLCLVLKGTIMFYGIGCLSSSAPAHSGGIYFILTFVYFFLFRKEKKIVHFFAMVISSILVLCTISRTNILALVVFYGLVCLVGIMKVFNFKKFKRSSIIGVMAIILLVFTLLFLSTFLMDNVFLMKLVSRFQRFDSSKMTRVLKWQEILSFSTKWGIIFGNGAGYHQLIYRTGFTLSTDSQYVCLINESGIVGLIMWLLIMKKISFDILKKYKRNFYSIMATVLVIVYCFIGITLEIFQTSLQATIFWIIIGTIFAYNQLIDNENLNNVGVDKEC